MLVEHKQTLAFLICLVGIFTLLGSIYMHTFIGRHNMKMMYHTESEKFHEPPDGVMTVALVACGLRSLELAVSIKSMLMFTEGFLDIRIFADEMNRHDISIIELLPDVDRLIYVDTDTLFFVPVEEVWSLFDSFNSVHIAAIAWHNEDDTLKTYNEDSMRNIPFYKPYGINSGVILMDLKRMAAANWNSLMDKYFDEYKDIIPYGDQDLMNIYFYYHPELLMKLDCKYNYRLVFCMYEVNQCKTVIDEGVSILHGVQSVFRRMEITFQGFKHIHELFRVCRVSSAFQAQLTALKETIYNFTRTEDRCRDSYDHIFKRLDNIV